MSYTSFAKPEGLLLIKTLIVATKHHGSKSFSNSSIEWQPQVGTVAEFAESSDSEVDMGVGMIQWVCDVSKKECSQTIGFRWHLLRPTSCFTFFTKYHKFQKFI